MSAFSVHSVTTLLGRGTGHEGVRRVTAGDPRPVPDCTGNYVKTSEVRLPFVDGTVPYLVRDDSQFCVYFHEGLQKWIITAVVGGIWPSDPTDYWFADRMDGVTYELVGSYLGRPVVNAEGD